MKDFLLVLALLLGTLVYCCGLLLFVVILYVSIRWSMIQTEKDCERSLEQWAAERGYQLRNQQPLGWANAWLAFGHTGSFDVTILDHLERTVQGVATLRRVVRLSSPFLRTYRVQFQVIASRPIASEPSPLTEPKNVREDPLWDCWLDNSP